MRRILIVDDERAARIGLKRALKSQGYEIGEAEDGVEALAQVESFKPDLMILDLNMPRLDGMGVLRALREQESEVAVIVLTAYGTEKVAVEAMKEGAQDYLTKPYDVEELRLTVGKALETVGLKAENARLRDALEEQRGFDEMVGESDAMGRVFELLKRIAGLNVAVLIRGESGTGKELVAKAIHKRSPRRKGPFVAINCAALPDTLIESELFGHKRGAFTGAESDRQGKFELANGGTLLLDEIGDMNIEVQAKLLRTLEERNIEPLGGSAPVPVDVRVIAATHKNLEEAMQEGRFRKDLYFRLKVVEVKLPRLVDRLEDVPLLVRRFVDFFAKKHSRPPVEFSREALLALQKYSWPGNVRELKNLIEGVFVMCSSQEVGVDDLPLGSAGSLSVGALELPADLYQQPFSDARKIVVQTFERDFVEHHLNLNQGNISRTASALGMHRQSLQQKIKELGVDVNRFRSQ